MNPNARAAFAAILFSLLLLCYGCASANHQVQVNSISRLNPAQPAASYRIRNKNPAVDDQSLRYQEATRHIKTALSAQGLYEAPNTTTADMIVELDYGIEAAQVKYNVYNVPIFGRTGGKAPSGFEESLDASVKELLGYQPEVFPVTVRAKRLSVCARENRPSSPERPPEEFWRIEVCIEDKSHDLRGYLPILASAAMDHIGLNTNGDAKTVVRADGEAVQFVKKGL